MDPKISEEQLFLKSSGRARHETAYHTGALDRFTRLMLVGSAVLALAGAGIYIGSPTARKNAADNIHYYGTAIEAKSESMDEKIARGSKTHAIFDANHRRPSEGAGQKYYAALENLLVEEGTNYNHHVYDPETEMGRLYMDDLVTLMGVKNMQKTLKTLETLDKLMPEGLGHYGLQTQDVAFYLKIGLKANDIKEIGVKNIEKGKEVGMVAAYYTMALNYGATHEELLSYKQLRNEHPSLVSTMPELRSPVDLVDYIASNGLRTVTSEDGSSEKEQNSIAVQRRMDYISSETGGQNPNPLPSGGEQGFFKVIVDTSVLPQNMQKELDSAPNPNVWLN